ncbi:olefin beta-lactone synthetase [Photobacterium alginatilyticum]|uniref:Peptide synthase n=1 Tax=Photobacterium alginatilyticum TaxID=1775171 RepID=A0ABW9YGD2_9GAMM|nr:fatty acid CoA ligase family protein [Photobacterium alginatilyticum]NBI52667.1 peptide synthase [Photobacterium alginatilyticum]
MADEHQANICRHLKRAAEETPDALAVAVQKRLLTGRFRYQELNFAALDAESDRIARVLAEYGITRGMKAVLMVTPSLDFFALTFALFKAGVIPILVDPGMGIKNLRQCFAEAEPDAFIGIPKAHIARCLFGWGKSSVRRLLTVGGSELFAKVFGGTSLKALLKADANYQASSANNKTPITHNMALLGDDEMAAILFTSGSTGTPKGVVYTHAMFEAQINVLKNDYGIVPGERDLATFPLFSLFGPALGMASIVPDMDASKPITANPDNLFAAIEQYQCSNMFVNPALIERLGQAGTASTKAKAHTLPRIRRVISAGAPATISSIARFSKMLKGGVEVLNSYGATESLPLTMIGSEKLLNTTDITDSGGGICVGKPVGGVDVAIIAITDDPITKWDEALRLPVDTIGEIVVKGPMVSHSYYRRASATEQAKIIDIADGPAEHSIRHRMGDLGYLDQHGQLWMCGRKAHRVEANRAGSTFDGEPYFSIPCERIFNTHPKVRRTALVGVEIRGETAPLLCVELENGGELEKSESAVEHFYDELRAIGEKHRQTAGIVDFLIHPDFPVDIRHNAKIFREKLAVWAQDSISK